jgi:hypothetical protein
MARPTVIVGKADAADAPQRKKKRRRAPRIVFPDPDHHRKDGTESLWMVQSHLIETRLFHGSVCLGRALARAVRKAVKQSAANAVQGSAAAQAATFHDD